MKWTSGARETLRFESFRPRDRLIVYRVAVLEARGADVVDRIDVMRAIRKWGDRHTRLDTLRLLAKGTLPQLCRCSICRERRTEAIKVDRGV